MIKTILIHYLIETLRIALESVEEDLHGLFVRSSSAITQKKEEENLNWIVLQNFSMNTVSGKPNISAIKFYLLINQ